MSAGNRASGRIPMPDLGQIRNDANLALGYVGLEACQKVEPVADGDTMNPAVIGYTHAPRYVIKVIYPNARKQNMNLKGSLKLANEIRKRTGIPVPEHYCMLEEPGRLPLMIMEFMPGEQLRLLLQRASPDECRAVCRDWGRCIARLHDPKLNDLIDDFGTPEGAAHYWRERTKAYLEEHSDSDWHRNNSARIMAYIDERLPLMTEYQYPSVSKHDLDVRDFLALAKPVPRISAMLDWERVSIGDALTALVGIWVRLHYLKTEQGCPSFLEAYENERGIRLRQSRQVEFYLINRAILPTNHNAPARKIIDGLLEGTEYPFSQRTCK